MKTRKSPAFSFYPDSWVGGTIRLPPVQRAAYIDLLANQWLDGPFDLETAIMICRGIPESDVRAVLKAKFVDNNGIFYNARLEHEREKQQQFNARQRKNGEKGGRPKTQTEPTYNPKHNPDETQTITQTETQTKAKNNPSVSVSVSVLDSITDSVPPPPPTPPLAAVAEIEKLFRGIGLSTAKRASQLFADRPVSEIQTAIADYLANGDKLKSPNSVVYFLENGSWPAEGVKPAIEAKLGAKQRQDEQRRKVRDSIRCDIASEWKKSGLWANASEIEIEAEIDSRLKAGRHVAKT